MQLVRKKAPLKKLSPQHIKFIERYILLSMQGEKSAAEKATIYAGYSPKSAASHGSNLLDEPIIKAYKANRIDELLGEDKEKQLRIVGELEAIADSNIRDILHFDGVDVKFKSFDDLTRAETAAITSVKQKTTYTVTGDIVKEIDMKTGGKDAAHGKLMKIRGMDKQKIEVDMKVDQDVDWSKVPTDELLKIIEDKKGE